MRILLTLFILLSYHISVGQGIYQCSILSQSDSLVSLKMFQGRKMMILTVEDRTINEDAKALSSFLSKNRSDIVVIMLPLQISSKGFGKELTKKVNRNGVVTFFDYSGGKSGSPTLLDWVTNRGLNSRFQIDKVKPGYKFFIDEAGGMYGAIGPEFSLSSPVIEKILKKPSTKP